MKKNRSKIPAGTKRELNLFGSKKGDQQMATGKVTTAVLVA